MVKPNTILKLIITAVLLTVIGFILKPHKVLKDPVLTEPPLKKSKTIPKIIWTYWNNNKLPEFVEKCVDTWRKYNPDYQINVVTPANLGKYVEIDVKEIHWNDSREREADIIRAIIIEKYGGVWSDASIIMTKSLNQFINTDKEFVGFYIKSFTSNMDYPVLENWFFASVAHGDFIRRWKAAFFNVGNFACPTFASDHYINLGVDTQKIDSKDYLFMHIAAQYVMQIYMTPDEICKTMRFQEAESGPFKYLALNSWNTKKALKSLCAGENITDIIKLRGVERNYVIKDRQLMECIYNKLNMNRT
jgi:hypothetical protein